MASPSLQYCSAAARRGTKGPNLVGKRSWVATERMGESRRGNSVARVPCQEMLERAL